MPGRPDASHAPAGRRLRKPRECARERRRPRAARVRRHPRVRCATLHCRRRRFRLRTDPSRARSAGGGRRLARPDGGDRRGAGRARPPGAPAAPGGVCGNRGSARVSAGDRAPLVSVVIPAYDAQPFIAAAVASACAQTHRALEVLVVDDGSRDRTAAIVEALAARDPRVRLLRRPHRGVAAARNRAIEEARGEYIAPLDADDIWLPAKIERQLRALERAPAGTGLVYGWSADLDADGRLTGGYCAHELPPHVPAALLFRNFIGCSSVPLIRRICFERAGAYQPAYAARGAQGCEDLDLYRRIARYYEFALVREFLVGYRQTPGRMSSNALAMARSFRLALRDC